jgi:DNA polymerase III subunit delta'
MLFRDIPGQQAIKERLVRTVNENRVSHAQLFLGPEGSGNLALAIAYAQYINCRHRTMEDACGVCPSCIKYDKLAHPDLHFIYPVAKTKEVDEKPLSRLFVAHWRKLMIEKKSFISLFDWYQEIGIEKKQGIINAEDASEVVRTLSYKSFEAEYKVMIIWMVEKLFHAAAPKLLKIIEEPPEKTLFILVSENADQVISTILSRTQLIKIPALGDDDVMKFLTEHYEISDSAARQVALMADGNLVEANLLVRRTGSANYNFEQFRSWMLMCWTGDVTKMLAFGTGLSSLGRERLKDFFAYGLRIVRSCLVYRHGESNSLKFEGKELEFVQKFSSFIHSANTRFIAEEFEKAYYHIERNANINILFADLSYTMSELLKMPASAKPDTKKM